MEIERTKRLQIVSFAVLVAAMILIIVGCGMMVGIATRAAGTADVQTKKVFARLALLATCTLGLALVLLLWAVMRFISNRIGPARESTATEYVSAWEEAGKRFKIEETPDDDEDDEDRPAPPNS